ncbi:tubulin-specific chaperone C [Teleopsis dalmanni]|uniref:tubulin-specific chaperone C n=1 Tax=Teleopsis dalmanni TaxID=139649 RepID=UPI000D32BB5F|nr:tubulin-specific chaperone C [Teleopsis dalmanni]
MYNINPSVDRGVDNTDSANRTTGSILERLNKRNKDRQNYNDIRTEQRNKAIVQLEDEDNFAQMFAQRAQEIMAQIKNITDSAIENKLIDPVTKADLGRLFSNVTIEIRDLQNYLTSSTIFLTEFKVKSCQMELNEITSLCEQTRAKLIPKKKFGFSNRNANQKLLQNSKTLTTKLNDNKNFEYLNANKTIVWTLCNRKDEYIMLSRDEVDEKDVTLSNLKNCFIELQGHPGSVQASHLNNCILLCGPIMRSFFAENCQNSTFALACQQLRLHSSSDCRIYLFVSCRAVIEDCKEIEFGNYNYHYPSIDSDFTKANLSRAINNYTDVADFNWLSPDTPSPNWRLLNNCSPNWYGELDKFKNKNIL